MALFFPEVSSLTSYSFFQSCHIIMVYDTLQTKVNKASQYMFYPVGRQTNNNSNNDINKTTQNLSLILTCLANFCQHDFTYRQFYLNVFSVGTALSVSACLSASLSLCLSDQLSYIIRYSSPPHTSWDLGSHQYLSQRQQSQTHNVRTTVCFTVNSTMLMSLVSVPM